MVRFRCHILAISAQSFAVRKTRRESVQDNKNEAAMVDMWEFVLQLCRIGMQNVA